MDEGRLVFEFVFLGGFAQILEGKLGLETVFLSFISL